MMAPKESKFIRMAEVLPNNATTAKILKEREEIKLAKEERDKAVSTPEPIYQTSRSIQTSHQPLLEVQIFTDIFSVLFS